MSQKGNNGDKKEEMVAVAIDKDKGSQAALKWAVDNLLSKGKRVTLIHVKQKTSIAVASNILSLSHFFFSKLVKIIIIDHRQP